MIMPYLSQESLAKELLVLEQLFYENLMFLFIDQWQE